MEHRKRRSRPPVLEWTVFALAAFLALFLVYETAKRRVKSQQQPPPAQAQGQAPRGLTEARLIPRAVDDPPERGQRPSRTTFKTERRAPRKNTHVPTPGP